MNIQLKERKIATIQDLSTKTTFKLYGSLDGQVYMKIDVEGLSISEKAQEEVKIVGVKIPEGKAPLLCLNTGKTVFMKLDEKVEVVELKCVEVLKEEK